MAKQKISYMKFSENRTDEAARAIFEQRISDAKDIYRKHSGAFVERVCPFCGSETSRDVEKFYDKYGVKKCVRCTSLFVSPCPDISALDDYYSNYKCNILLDQTVKKRKDKKDNFIIDDRVVKVVEAIEYFVDSGVSDIRILEIGCGSGSFLSKLKRCIADRVALNCSIQFRGIDIDKNAIANNVDDELDLVCASVEEYAKMDTGSVDIVLHFELIEHLIDPYGFMLEQRKLLRKNGMMIFTTQNLNGLEMVASDYNSYRLLAHSIFPPMHLNAFSTMNVLHFCIRSGFNVLEITTPGKLDIDMLSKTKDYIEDDGLKALADLDENAKGLIQYMVSILKSSSHMQCVTQKG